MNAVRNLWWAGVSVIVVVIGLIGPWARTAGAPADGTADELVSILVGVSAVSILFIAFSHRSSLAILPLLTGAVGVIVIGGNLRDPAGPFGGPGPNVSWGWGIWVTLAGLLSLVFASLILLRQWPRQTSDRARVNERLRHRARLLDPRIVGPTRRGLWRAGRARAAERAAEQAQRMAAAASSRERDFRKELAEIAARVTEYLTVELDGLVYVLPARQKFGVGRFANLDWKEHRHLDRALDHLKTAGIRLRGTTFVDIGANIGTTTVRAVGKHGFASACAIEPEPGNLRLLRVNLTVNGFEEVVRVVPCALSNQGGEGVLELSRRSGGKHRLVHSGSTKVATIRVPLATLDSLVTEGVLDRDSVGLLWVDVQGHELEVLEGAGSLLERSVPIVFEFDSRELDAPRIEALQDEFEGRYSCLVDLSRVPSEQEVLPIADLGQIAARHRRTFTDLLVYQP
jgi:FkbM family methyltransferase